MNFKSFSEVDRLTIPEYNLLMEAVHLKQVDTDYRVHMLAWLTFAAKATKGKGKHTKPVYGKFKRFYDYENEIAKVLKPKTASPFSGIGKFLKKRG